MSVLADNTTRNVLIRDQYTCQLRLEGCDRYATHVVLKDPAPRTTLRAPHASELIAVCRDCATNR